METRLVAFLITIFVLSFLEFAFKFSDSERDIKRNRINLGLCLLDIFVLKLLPFTTPVLLAFHCKSQGLGILNIFDLPKVLTIALGIVALDFFIYLQHVLTHRVDWLWRLHAVHHSDTHLDATSALRFHPIEILLSQIYKLILVFALGVNPISVIIFEVLLNCVAMFNHADIKIPHTIDRFLSLFIVTPRIHRIHHSIKKEETNSNYGFCIVWWDHLFKTYSSGSGKVIYGRFLGEKNMGFWQLLKLPFKKP